MERSQFSPLTPSDQAPNPLRPYYRPPSIGNTSASTDQNFAPPASKVPASFGSSARSILSDLNYGDIIGQRGASTADNIRSLLDQAMWKYSSVFMAQPFEVAKMVLQVRAAQQLTKTGSARDLLNRSARTNSRNKVFEIYDEEDYEDDDDDDDDDHLSYFTSAAPQTQSSVSSTSPPRSKRSRQQQLKPAAPTPAPKLPLYRLDLLKQDSVLEVIGQLWTREGAWGIWKGTNVTFLHNLLHKTIETWLRGMLSAMFNLPDPGIVISSSGVGGIDILDSPSPWSSLGVVVAAASVAGLLLAPLDIVRTRVMLTTTTEPPRSTLPCLRALPSWLCPSSLLAPTLLHSTLPTLISTSTPLILRSNLRIDPIITPLSYSVCTFLSSIAELFIKLPVETVLRRGQISYVEQSAAAASLSSTSRNNNRPRSNRTKPDSPALPIVVETGPYTGVLSTMWRIVREEGESLEHARSSSATAQATSKSNYAPRRGQGVQGLCRGWKVGVWGIVGVWGAASLGAGGDSKGGEF